MGWRGWGRMGEEEKGGEGVWGADQEKVHTKR